MTIDPEELKKRRAQRKRKRLLFWLRLGAAALVLIASFVTVWLITRPKKPSEAELNDPANQTVIRLAAAGDLNVSQAVVAAGGDQYDYTAMLMDVLPLLGQADITALNFEGTLSGEPYGEDRAAPQQLMTALSRAGVDYIQLANSYSVYHGMEGLAKTLQGVRSAGIEPLGAYATSREAKEQKGYSIRTVQGIKIAFVAFTKGMDGMVEPKGYEGCVNVLYEDYATDYQKVNNLGIEKILSAVEKEAPDITVAFVHWGSEFNDTISPSQEKICKLLQEGGVDVVIGTHSHYVQRMDFDRETGTFVAWSLGDFLGDSKREDPKHKQAASEYSVVLELEITKNAVTGQTKVTGYSYTPIFTVEEEGKPVRVVRIREAIAGFDQGYIDKVEQTTYDAMTKALVRIEERIHPKKKK